MKKIMLFAASFVFIITMGGLGAQTNRSFGNRNQLQRTPPPPNTSSNVNRAVQNSQRNSGQIDTSTVDTNTLRPTGSGSSSGGGSGGVAPAGADSSGSADCESLPTSFSGGDLSFRSVCFFGQVSGAVGIAGLGELFIEMNVVNNSTTTAIPDGLGMRVSVIPDYEKKKTYNICNESSMLDLGYPTDPLRGNLSNFEHIIVGVPSARAWPAGTGASDLNGLKIIIDPNHYIAEENEGNNMIHCTSFNMVPYDSSGNAPLPCLNFREDRRIVERGVDTGRSLAGSSLTSDYVGPCTIINSNPYVAP